MRLYDFIRVAYSQSLFYVKSVFRYIALTLSIYKNILLPDKFNFVQINLFV
jgi:hypothetical protein